MTILETGFVDRAVTVGGETFRYRVWVPPGWTADREWPVVLFLHGAGEGGIDGRRQTLVGLGPAIRRHPERFPSVVVFPQARRGQPWRGPMADLARAALDRSLAEFAGDPGRVSLTGVSMGGYGTWSLALDEPDRFVALVPVCGGLGAGARRRPPADPRDPADPFLAAACVLAHVPIWVFHGEDDPIIPVAESRVMVAALRRVGAEVRYTEYARVAHDSWDAAYAEPALPPWLLAQRGGGR